MPLIACTLSRHVRATARHTADTNEGHHLRDARFCALRIARELVEPVHGFPRARQHLLRPPLRASCLMLQARRPPFPTPRILRGRRGAFEPARLVRRAASLCSAVLGCLLSALQSLGFLGPRPQAARRTACFSVGVFWRVASATCSYAALRLLPPSRLARTGLLWRSRAIPRAGCSLEALRQTRSLALTAVLRACAKSCPVPVPADCLACLGPGSFSWASRVLVGRLLRATTSQVEGPALHDSGQEKPGEGRALVHNGEENLEGGLSVLRIGCNAG